MQLSNDSAQSPACSRNASPLATPAQGAEQRSGLASEYQRRKLGQRFQGCVNGCGVVKGWLLLCGKLLPTRRCPGTHVAQATGAQTRGHNGFARGKVDEGGPGPGSLLLNGEVRAKPERSLPSPIRGRS